MTPIVMGNKSLFTFLNGLGMQLPENVKKFLARKAFVAFKCHHPKKESKETNGGQDINQFHTK
jgi:hypothetical protein